MSPNAKVEKGNQATHSGIAWLWEEHNLFFADCCIWGNAFTFILRFFGHEVAGKNIKTFFEHDQLMLVKKAGGTFVASPSRIQLITASQTWLAILPRFNGQ